MAIGPEASLNNFRPFPADSAWNQDISAAPVDPNSAAIINFIGSSTLHPDFSIPYVVVDGSQSLVNVLLTSYSSTSDPGPMPVPSNAPIEGDPNPGNGDRHVLVLDRGNCFLYELYSAFPNSDGTWSAASAATWDMLANEQRPWMWPSADAAGLPMFPGLIRYDEVASGQIQHAVRVTLQLSRAAVVPPATNSAATSTNSLAAPMGMRLRLKANYDISGFSPSMKVILTALKKYGMIMADNGANLFVSGTPDSRWNSDELHTLTQVPASAFEVVQMNPVYTSATVPTGPAPVISSFTASSGSVSAGTAVTLNWQVSGASYLVISPQVGAVRGTSVQVSPQQSTTYVLYATNQYGRTTASVSVTVH